MSQTRAGHHLQSYACGKDYANTQKHTVLFQVTEFICIHASSDFLVPPISNPKPWFIVQLELNVTYEPHSEMASASQSLEARELSLVGKVEMRIALADSDERLENILNTYLPPLLLKLASECVAVRNKVISICQHINTRVKPRYDVQYWSVFHVLSLTQ